MAGSGQQAFLDRPAARVLALIVIVLCCASLAYLHRDDLFPKQQETALEKDDPVVTCTSERFADIDKMLDEGTIETAQADLFRQRAEAMCRDTVGKGVPTAPSSSTLPNN